MGRVKIDRSGVDEQIDSRPRSLSGVRDRAEHQGNE